MSSRAVRSLLSVRLFSVLVGAALVAMATAHPAQAQHDHPAKPDSVQKRPRKDSAAVRSTMSPMNGMAGMDMHHDSSASVMSGVAMGSVPLDVPMQRMGSGTSWVPDATTMHATHLMMAGWDVMLHGVAFLQYDHQGTKRGDSQLGSINWGMLMAGHTLAGGRLNLRGMFSAEPMTVGSQGYPLLLQSGESYRGKPLYDRQHPHDLFMELAAMYDHAIGENLALSLYVAPVGEPAIGPVAFPHRPSAANDPLAPISHHWQDATHVSFGVVTAGVYTRTVRLEASIFNGREPDAVRTNFDFRGRSLDSYAARLTVNPTEHWSLSGSYAYLESPEQLYPDESMHRISASMLYGRPVFAAGDWSSAVIYGGNKHAGESRISNSLVGELNLAFDASNTMFGRAEYVEKGPEDLPAASPVGQPIPMQYKVKEFTLGYVREIVPLRGGSLGLGAAGTVNMVPSSLGSAYGTRTPLGAIVFLRVRPGAMTMHRM